MELKVKRLTDNLSVPGLSYSTEGSSGLDLYAAVSRAVLILAGEHVRVPTGYAVEIPEGYEGQVRARSGLAAGEHKLGLTNGIGTIDADYRGEISVLLHNQSKEVNAPGLWVTPGMKIAQLVIVPIAKVVPVEVDALDETDRGEGGFGSTGNGAASTDASAANAGGAASDLSETEKAIIEASQPVKVDTPPPPSPAPVVEETKSEEAEGNDSKAGSEQSSSSNDSEQKQTGAESGAGADGAASGKEDPDAELILFDTVNKVVFLGHASKETETVVVLSADEAAVQIAAGAQDRRPAA